MVSSSGQKKHPPAGDSSRDLLIPRSLEVTYIAIDFGSRFHSPSKKGHFGWMDESPGTFFRMSKRPIQKVIERKANVIRQDHLKEVTEYPGDTGWKPPTKKKKHGGFSVKELEGYIPENSQGTQQIVLNWWFVEVFSF